MSGPKASWDPSRPAGPLVEVEGSCTFVMPRGHLYVAVPPGNEDKLVTAVALLDRIAWRFSKFIPGGPHQLSPTKAPAVCQLSNMEIAAQAADVATKDRGASANL